MNPRTLRWPALAFCCLLLGACRDRHEPVKPTVFDAAGAVLSAALVIAR